MRKLGVLTAAAVLVAVMGFGGTAWAALDFPSLPDHAAYYDFEGGCTGDTSTVVDVTANGNDGTLNDGSCVSGSPAPLAPGNETYLDLDGVDGHVSVPDDNTLDLSGDITVAAWVYRDTTGTHYIVTKEDQGTPETNYNFAIFGDKVFFAVTFDAAVTDPNNFPSEDCDPGGCLVSGATDVPTGEWHHVAGVYDDSTQTITVYLDGVPDGSFNFDTAGSPTPNDDPLKIGERDLGGSNFDGMIDEVRIIPDALIPLCAA